MTYCEDFPCCGHEAGDCDGSLYGSDESIKAYALAHVYCDHEAGVYDCDDLYMGEDEDDEDDGDSDWVAEDAWLDGSWEM